MSKSINIVKVEERALVLDYSVLLSTFSSVDTHAISQAPWKDKYPYQPHVSFQCVHSVSMIGLHYTVEEEFVKANAMVSNENVWEDSCVEFFISLDNKNTYYNFEFNVLGTGLIGFGPAIKSERNRLTAEQIESVSTLTQVIQSNGNKTWEIYLLIPKTLLTKQDMSGNIFHGNFYKCGDNLPRPHFISWNAIENASPNFHLPQFFGNLIFE